MSVEPDCPLCGASVRQIEHLREGWRICPSCTFCHLMNDAGEVIATSPSNKTPKGIGFTNSPRVEKKKP